MRKAHASTEATEAREISKPDEQWREELTPLHGDPLAAVPVTVAAVATLIRPAMWRQFSGGAVGAYALTPDAWRRLTSVSREAGSVHPGHGEGAAG